MNQQLLSIQLALSGIVAAYEKMTDVHPEIEDAMEFEVVNARIDNMLDEELERIRKAGEMGNFWEGNEIF